MPDEKLTLINNKLKEMFDGSAIKTVGDLAQAQHMEDWEKIPEGIRNFSLEPDGPLAFPSAFYYLMGEAGFPLDTTDALAEAIGVHQIDNLRQAIQTLSL